ncbi:MAG: cbb3-type cytochrome oxidase assembly protein CcoS [Gammaproteobacteria bacterium]|nr:cbb3-type cytochrome oxidase assembly protein CcoS [Gammaproteobacteria bacterium]MCW8839980.1 cbb3-type cytochrome oxidase assembly protein CcoS [Gammaproteobacteria bacterium]MCW8927804.1 cbb3-type cytochrome oxidase assembly protein CcoS [Gammaproteobacteria bacterium]MCW8958267.1 cbb3-type cytochrome oxidase assembly protein CcoS [Gammaproteobacteria bacterium]MCW8972926.1 cbb3-type cytochrome oxidase assembly protein CcoS [Gammaproteobacteria bacterium]
MEVIYKLIPGMIVLGLIFVGILIWAVKKGQYDDLEGDGQRILLDEDEEKLPQSKGGRKVQVGKNFPDTDD